MPVAEFEFPPKTYADRKRNVAQVLWTIHLDGPFEDGSGRATAKLLEALRKRRVLISPAVLNNILNDLDGAAALYGHLVTRQIKGKRTNEISLRVNPYKVPFPKNPWPAEVRATFKPSGSAPVDTETGEGDEGFSDLEETFTRQALVSQTNGNGGGEGEGEDMLARLKRISAAEDADEPVEEEVVEEDVVDEPVVEEPVVSAELDTIEPRRTTADPISIPDVNTILDDLGIGGTPVTTGSSGQLLNSAIGLITQAMTIRIEEDAARRDQDHGDIERRIDERMSTYVALIERNAALESKLRQSMTRERELIDLVRTLQAALQAQQAANGTAPR